MRLIPLSGKRGAGFFAIVDDEDYERFAREKWHLHSQGYAARKPHGCTTYILLHREIAQSGSLGTDHVNRNKLDNRRANLRPADQMLNGRNTNTQANNTSGVRGVHRTRCGRWEAYIKVRGKKIGLGNHLTIEAAASARAMGEERLWGDAR